MTFRSSISRRALGVALMLLAAGPLSISTVAQQKFAIKPIAEKRLKELPAGPLYWHIYNFQTLAEAQAAENAASLTAEIAGKVWLFSLGPKGDPAIKGSKVAEIGPTPDVSAAEYLLRINYADAPPEAKTPVHTHPGSETFYVLTGKLGQKTPSGQMDVEAGQPMAGHMPGTPMEVSNDGNVDMTAIVMFVVDATKPFSSPSKME